MNGLALSKEYFFSVARDRLISGFPVLYGDVAAGSRMVDYKHRLSQLR